MEEYQGAPQKEQFSVGDDFDTRLKRISQLKTNTLEGSQMETENSSLTLTCKKCKDILPGGYSFCPKCGKRLKSRFNKHMTIIIGLSIVIVLLGVLNIYQRYQVVAVSAKNSLQITKINALQETVDSQKFLINGYYKRKTEKADFLDSHVALVTKAGEKYHTYDCRYFKNMGAYYVYNIREADQLGYEPCSVCHSTTLLETIHDLLE